MLTHFAFSHEKIFRFFKFDNIKRKPVDLNYDNIEMFRHNSEVNFDILLKIRKD